MEPMVIKVHGVPSIPSHDRMVDQLTIHFLKRRNNGGDVLTVIHPTSTAGQAYVIFESAEVPAVLECTHVLDVDNRFYPIHVMKAHLSEVDMPVETTLDLSMFPKPDTVLKLLKDYDFNVKQLIPGHLQLEGSFLKLKLIRNKLIQLRGHERQSRSRAPSSLHNGSTLGYDMGHDSMDPRFVSKSISRNGNKLHAVSQHQSPDSTPSLSSFYRDSASGEFPRSRQSSHSSYIDRHVSSPVDPVVQKYQWQDSKQLLGHRLNHLGDGASPLSANSSFSFTHTSPLYRDSASSGSPTSLHGSYYSSIGSTSHTGDTMQHHTSYSASGGSPRNPPASYYSSTGSIRHAGDTMQHHTSYRDSASGGSPRSLHGRSSIESTCHTGDTMQHHTSYRDSASGGSPRNPPASYYSSIGSTSHTGDTMQHHTSYRDSVSGDSFRRGPSFDGDTYSSPSSPSGGMEIFPVDTDSLSFIITQRQNEAKVIKEHYGTEMELKHNAGITMVTLRGKNSEKAKAYLLSIIKELSPSLRTQKIYLDMYDHTEQKQILERINQNTDSGVMITHSNDVVKLVGSSKKSFEMMQKIMGHNDDSHRGRTMERSSKARRSISLPRPYKQADHERITDQRNQASVAKKNSPSHQGESDEGKAPPIVRGPEQTLNKNSQRTRSSSESRDKIRAAREQSIDQNVELVSSSREKKSLKQELTDRLKLNDMNKIRKDFKLRIKK